MSLQKNDLEFKISLWQQSIVESFASSKQGEAERSNGKGEQLDGETSKLFTKP